MAVRPIPARKLLALVDAFRRYRYSAVQVGYPWPLPGLHLPLVAKGAPRATNCVCFLEALLVRAFGLDEWGVDMHRAFMVQGSDKFGPVHAAIESGMADPILDQEWPGDWRLVQGWRPDGGGHAFVVVRTEGDGRLLILEANRAYGLDGVGYRDVGDRWGLGEALLPASPSTWTWDRLRSTYPVMRACALRVDPSE